MVEKLWDLANLITGFAVAHALTMTYALAKHEIVALKDLQAHVVSGVLAVFFLLLYWGAIWWCYDTARELGPDPKHLEIWRSSTVGRCLAVFVFKVVMLTALVGHWKALRKCATKHTTVATKDG